MGIPGSASSAIHIDGSAAQSNTLDLRLVTTSVLVNLDAGDLTIGQGATQASSAPLQSHGEAPPNLVGTFDASHRFGPNRSRLLG